MAAAQAPEPIRLRPHGLDFAELKDLIEYLERVQSTADASLQYFRDPAMGGFGHRVNPGDHPKKSSKASTATCLAYLRAAGKLTGKDWTSRKRSKLRRYTIDEPWRSAGLSDDNPFTTAFLLESIHALGGAKGLDAGRAEKVDAKIALLNASLSATGGLSIDRYPPNAFLTYNAVHALAQWGRLDDQARERVANWNWSHLYEESMLISSLSQDEDFFELIYAVITASVISPLGRMTPRERRLLQHAIEQFFAGQREDGTWPRSRPLFLYPGIGYAYCYDSELLVQLLTERQLRPLVAPHLKELRKAAWALDARRVPLEGRAYGWSSEHQGQTADAESWPTASVFHFCFELERLVSDAIRRDIFEYVDAAYDEPRDAAPGGVMLAGQLDSPIDYNGRTYSFKERFTTEFLGPLVQDRDVVRAGRRFSNAAKISAIVYGPPGTSKTSLARMVADALGWPLLPLDPSHLTRRGLDYVHAEADALFVRLRFCDQVVVLLDEFDELVRERAGTWEYQSRFLTTAMLPKIAALHARRRLVYIVATNHLEQFDAAISRPGRFDVIVPLMPPTAEEKYRVWPDLLAARDHLRTLTPPEDVDELIGDLTYAEAEALATRIVGVDDDVLRDAFATAGAGATLNSRVLDSGGSEDLTVDAAGAETEEAPESWRQNIVSQQAKIRGIGL
ncbi:MAG TPA: AAA family ATPase [Solirubrobacteraceae bacterium]|jgi:hypothetical protein